MQITPQNLYALNRELRIKWENGMQAASKRRLWQPADLSEEDAVSTETVEVVWSEKLPRMKKWTTNKEIQNTFLRSFTAKNEKYHNLHEIDEATIERNDARRLNNLTRGLVEAASSWVPNLVIDCLRNGGATFKDYIGFDKKPIYDTAHPVHLNDDSLGPQSNIFNTMPLTDPNYEKAISRMMEFKGIDGEPLGVYPDILLVGPRLAGAAKRIVQARTVSTGGENINAGTTKLIVMPELIPPGTPDTSPIHETWYLFSTSMGVMPIITQLEKRPQYRSNLPGGGGVTTMDGMAISTEKLLFDTPARGCAYILAWFLTAKFTP